MFKSKLTEALKQSTAWRDLADSLEKLNAKCLEPTLDRLKGMTNVFTMHPDDLQVLFDEMGSFFSVGLTEDEDIPLLLQQRTDEIHFKGYEYPLKKTFAREFLGVPLSWEQLYAPKDLVNFPYGSKFLLKRDIVRDGSDLNDYFQTYRAVIFTRLDRVQSAFGIDEFERLLSRVAIPLVPTHIAFDGQQYYLEAIIIGDKPLYLDVPATRIVDTTPKRLTDSLTKTKKLTVSGIQVIDVSAEKLDVSGHKPLPSHLILFDDFALDMIPLEINEIQGNW